MMSDQGSPARTPILSSSHPSQNGKEIITASSSPSNANEEVLTSLLGALYECQAGDPNGWQPVTQGYVPLQFVHCPSKQTHSYSIQSQTINGRKFKFDIVAETRCRLIQQNETLFLQWHLKGGKSKTHYGLQFQSDAEARDFEQRILQAIDRAKEGILADKERENRISHLARIGQRTEAFQLLQDENSKDAAQKENMVMIRVHLPGGASTMMRMPGNSSISEALATICEKRNLDAGVHVLHKPNGELFQATEVDQIKIDSLSPKEVTLGNLTAMVEDSSSKVKQVKLLVSHAPVKKAGGVQLGQEDMLIQVILPDGGQAMVRLPPTTSMGEMLYHIAEKRNIDVGSVDMATSASGKKLLNVKGTIGENKIQQVYLVNKKKDKAPRSPFFSRARTAAKKTISHPVPEPVVPRRPSAVSLGTSADHDDVQRMASLLAEGVQLNDSRIPQPWKQLLDASESDTSLMMTDPTYRQKILDLVESFGGPRKMLQLPSQELKDSFAKLAEFRKQKTVIPKNEVTRRRLATISTPSTSTGDSRTTPRRKAPAPPPAGAANQPTQNTSAVAGPPVPPRRPSAVSLTDESSPVPPKRAPPRPRSRSASLADTDIASAAAKLNSPTPSVPRPAARRKSGEDLQELLASGNSNKMNPISPHPRSRLELKLSSEVDHHDEQDGSNPRLSGKLQSLGVSLLQGDEASDELKLKLASRLASSMQTNDSQGTILDYDQDESIVDDIAHENIEDDDTGTVVGDEEKEVEVVQKELDDPLPQPPPPPQPKSSSEKLAKEEGKDKIEPPKPAQRKSAGDVPEKLNDSTAKEPVSLDVEKENEEEISTKEEIADLEKETVDKEEENKEKVEDFDDLNVVLPPPPPPPTMAKTSFFSRKTTLDSKKEDDVPSEKAEPETIIEKPVVIKAVEKPEAEQKFIETKQKSPISASKLPSKDDQEDAIASTVKGETYGFPATYSEAPQGFDISELPTPPDIMEDCETPPPLPPSPCVDDLPPPADELCGKCEGIMIPGAKFCSHCGFAVNEAVLLESFDLDALPVPVVDDDNDDQPPPPPPPDITKAAPKTSLPPPPPGPPPPAPSVNNTSAKSFRSSVMEDITKGKVQLRKVNKASDKPTVDKRSALLMSLGSLGRGRLSLKSVAQETTAGRRRGSTSSTASSVHESLLMAMDTRRSALHGYNRESLQEEEDQTDWD
eukprot:m.59673 g.59673  ORF g.59673 m.59673 type:complete len:1192 (+) comp11262_c0_seq1:229-3804(+)